MQETAAAEKGINGDKYLMYNMIVRTLPPMAAKCNLNITWPHSSKYCCRKRGRDGTSEFNYYKESNGLNSRKNGSDRLLKI